MTISKERVIELAREAGAPYVNRHYPGITSFGFTEDSIVAFAQAIRNEALGDSAILCFKRAAYIGNPIDSAHVMKCGESIQKLKEQQ